VFFLVLVFQMILVDIDWSVLRAGNWNVHDFAVLCSVADSRLRLLSEMNAASVECSASKELGLLKK
jgi:hypothetical protein